MTTLHNPGRVVYKKIFGDEAEAIESMLSELSLDLARLAIDFPFGEFYAKEHLLDLKTREFITLSTLVTQGMLPQLKLHIKAALSVGCSAVEIEQTFLQLIAYIGMPKVINAMKIFKEVIQEQSALP